MDTVIRVRPEVTRVPYEGGVLSVAEIRLGGTPRGTVVVFCDTGRLEYAATDVLNGLAEHGYSGLAADVGPVDGTGTSGALGLLATVRARGVPAAQIGVVGYGEGAGTALAVALAAEVAAAVGVSAAPGPLPAGARTLRTPWLGLYSTGGEHEQALRALVDRQPVYSRVVTYPGTAPTFYRADRRPEDHPASFDSFQRTLEWLNLRVEPCPTPFARSWAARRQERAGSPRPFRNGD